MPSSSGLLEPLGEPTEPGSQAPTPDDDAPGGARSLVRALALPLFVALVVRVLIALTDDVPAVDATAYLESGRNLWNGEGLTINGRPQVHFPPLLPAILGLLEKVFGSDQTALMVLTTASSVVLVLLAALLGHRLSGSARVAVAVAWVAGLAPGLAVVFVRADGGSAPLYTCLLFGGALCVLAARRRQGAAEHWWLAGAGLSLGLAYLCRPEALFAVVLLAAAVAVHALGGIRSAVRRPHDLRSIRRAAGLCVALVLPTMVCVVPYAGWLHGKTGQWQLSAKSQDASLEAWAAVAEGDRLTRDQILYRLDETGTAFDVETSSLVALAVEDPVGYARIFGVNLANIVGNYATYAEGPYFFSWRILALPLVLLGLYVAWRKRATDGVGVALLIALVPVITCLAFFTLARYLTPTTAILAVFAGWGLATLPERIKPVVWPLAVASLLWPVATFFHGPTGWGDPAETVEHRIAAEWLLENADPDDVVMARAFLVQYYLDRDVLAMPYGNLPDVLAFGKHYGAEWLVADFQNLAVYRPDLVGVLLGTFPSRNGLSLAYEFEYQGRLTRIYRIVPTPPPSDVPPIPLGWIGES